MRTQQEILDRIKAVADNDFFGHQRGDLYPYLTYENIVPLNVLKDGVTAADWEPSTKDPKAVMKEYMGFAFDKARNQRGLSAMRSIDHYTSWLWLDGNEALANEIQDYTDYGIPQLTKICDYLGIPVPSE